MSRLRRAWDAYLDDRRKYGRWSADHWLGVAIGLGIACVLVGCVLYVIMAVWAFVG